MDKAGYTTPSKAKPAEVCEGHYDDDLCSVCLSPFRGNRVATTLSPKKTDRGMQVQTKCNHAFHETCLMAARRWKSECPLCRSALSPIIQQIQWAHNNLNTMPSREVIVQAANRARNAVRLAMINRNNNPIGAGSM